MREVLEHVVDAQPDLISQTIVDSENQPPTVRIASTSKVMEWNLNEAALKHFSQDLYLSLMQFRFRDKPRLGLWTNHPSAPQWEVWNRLAQDMHVRRLLLEEPLDSLGRHLELDILVIIDIHPETSNLKPSVDALLNLGLPVVYLVDPSCLSCPEALTPEVLVAKEPMTIPLGRQMHTPSQQVIGDRSLATESLSVGYLEQNPFVTQYELTDSKSLWGVRSFDTIHRVVLFQGGTLETSGGDSSRRSDSIILATTSNGFAIPASWLQSRTWRRIADHKGDERIYPQARIQTTDGLLLLVADCDWISDDFTQKFSNDHGQRYWLAENYNILFFERLIWLMLGGKEHIDYVRERSHRLHAP